MWQLTHVHHIEKASVNLNCIWLTCLQVVQELVWLVATFLRYSNVGLSVVVWRIVGWYLILLLIVWLISVVSFHFQPLRVIVMYKCTQQNTGYDVAVQFVCPSVCHTCVLCVNGKMCCLVGLGAPLLFFILHERLRWNADEFAFVSDVANTHRNCELTY